MTWAAITLGAASTFFGNLRFGKDVLGVGFEDDFFYYLKIATNLALSGRSTFDGYHLTNGYHPLWLLVLAAIVKLLHVAGFAHPSNVIPLAAALETLQFVLLIAISVFCFRAVSMFCGPIASASITLILASWALVMVRTGMEVGLVLAVVFALLWFRFRPAFRWSPAQSAFYGLLCGVMILSRLDTVLLAGLLFVFDVAPNLVAARRKALLGLSFVAGLLPVFLYVAVNVSIFHAALPVSGTAKQLRLHRFPSMNALSSFSGFLLARNSPLLGVTVLLTAVALVVLVARGVPPRLQHRRVFLAALLFPFLHLLVVATWSDWQLWPWYLYPWLLSGVFGSTALSLAWKRRSGDSSHNLAAPVFAVSLLFFASYTFQVVRHSNPLHDLPYRAALDIQRFASRHPGVYAMGDRAGSVAYLLNDPVLQTEGLVMDKDFLDNIRSQKDLLQVLSAYKVRYYISTRSGPDARGCYAVKEPWQAGPDSPSMRAIICRTPVAVFQHDYFVNHVFDLQGLTPQTP